MTLPIQKWNYNDPHHPNESPENQSGPWAVQVQITYKPSALGSNTELQVLPHLDEQSWLATLTSHSLGAYGAFCLNHPEHIIAFVTLDKLGPHQHTE